MAIPSRGIGWSTEDNLLWQISKQLEQLTNVTAKACTNCTTTTSTTTAPAYKVYTALLNQSGSFDPVATVLENTLGGTPVWTRSGTGTYICTLTGAFTLNKTFCSAMYGTVWGNGALSFNFGVNDDNSIVLSSFNYDAGGLVNPIDFNNNPGNDICVEIRVYN